MSDRTLRADIVRALLLYLATRACITVFVWLTGQHFAAITPGLDRSFFPDNMLLNGLFQWDAFQYSQLATRGYYQGEGYDITLPFFPGFPLLAVAVGKLFGSHLVGGIVVNQLATLGGGVLIARLARALQLGDESVAQETTLFWLASPLTFFFCIYQTEALFAFASVLTLWAVVSGRWYVALVAGILATATRNTGMVVALASVLLAWERRKQVKVGPVGWCCIALMPLGMVGLIIYQKLTFNDGFAWVTSQKLWNRFLIWPWVTIRDEWAGWPGLSPATRSVQAMHRVQELLALGMLVPVFFARARLRLPWALLVLGVLEWVMPLASHSLLSSARYQAGNIYFALAIPALIAAHPMLRGVMWVASGMVLAWFASTWPYGFWAS